ncbi:MAG: PP2C family protein-serine/threonine phosphatase [Acidobacteriia bacterium]|nr:PP2C family protein-serine/threonine phosphatase [Terriglobia bacterium]
MQTAREIQGRFLPGRLPHIAGLDYCGDCRPAGDVGGDFFDFRRMPGNELAVSVGDVSGHGIGAAILMSGIQAFLRGLGRGSGEMPGVIEALNRVVCQVAPDNIYATLFYAHVDPERREVRYVSAGHEPPLLLRKRTGRAERLDSTGTVLGLTRRTVYEQRTMGMAPGDVLVAFTDGVTEAADAEGREWSENGVLSVLRRCQDARGSELVAEILESAGRFADPEAPTDDRTAVVVRLTGMAERPLQEEETMVLALAAA